MDSDAFTEGLNGLLTLSPIFVIDHALLDFVVMLETTGSLERSLHHIQIGLVVVLAIFGAPMGSTVRVSHDPWNRGNCNCKKRAELGQSINVSRDGARKSVKILAQT